MSILAREELGKLVLVNEHNRQQSDVPEYTNVTNFLSRFATRFLARLRNWIMTRGDFPLYPVPTMLFLRTQPHIHSDPCGYTRACATKRVHSYSQERDTSWLPLRRTWRFWLIHLAVIVRFMETLLLQTETAWEERGEERGEKK